MVKRSLITLAALASLAAVPALGNAEGKPSKADTTIDGRSIKRNSASIDMDYSTTKVNGRAYEHGPSMNLDANLAFNLNKMVDMAAMLNFNYQSMELMNKEATEEMASLNATLEARIKFYASDALRAYAKLGNKYFMENDILNLEGKKTDAKQNFIGPMIGIGIESRHIDAHMQGSLLFGEKKTSYDSDRDVRMLRLELEVIPRYWKFSLPIKQIIYNTVKTGEAHDRQNFRFRTIIRPTFDITPNLSIYLNYEITKNKGSDEYETYHAGGGLKFRF